MTKKQSFRIEQDSLGDVKVPKNALWGAQTQRAIENFPISGIKFKFPFGRSFIKALGAIKYSAASFFVRKFAFIDINFFSNTHNRFIIYLLKKK